MEGNDTGLTEHRTNCRAGRARPGRRRLWLVVSALWLQVMVIVFVIVQIQQQVHTPVTEWLSKAVRLLTSTDE